MLDLTPLILRPRATGIVAELQRAIVVGPVRGWNCCRWTLGPPVAATS